MPALCTKLRQYICVSCNSSFKRNGDLLSHQAQARECQWVYKKRKEIEPADQLDYRELSDLEDDPPVEMDMSELLLDADEDLLFNDDDSTSILQPEDILINATATFRSNDHQPRMEDIVDSDEEGAV